MTSPVNRALNQLVLPALCAVGLSASAGFAQLKVTQPEPPKDKPAKAPSTSPKEKPKADKPAAKSGELKVGDAAPAISAETWVKGDAVTGFESGKVYIVEFWATWCPPCRESIPHLTQLQRKHKNELVIVGMASSERAAAQGQPDKRLDNLRDFVKKQGAKMDYRVAFDPSRSMSKAWMEPAKQQYIPTAFVVSGEGKVVWINTVGGADERKELDKVVAAEIIKAKNAAKDAAPAKDAPSKDAPEAPGKK